MKSNEPLKFKMVETNVTVDADNKVTRKGNYEVISTGRKGQYLFPSFSASCEALIKKGYTEDFEYTEEKDTKGELTRKASSKSLAQLIVLGLRALNSQELVANEKKAFGNSPEKTDTMFLDLAKKVLANPQATATQKAQAQSMLDAFSK